MESTPYNEKHARYERQYHEDKALVLKRQFEEVDKGVQEEPEAEQA